MNQPFGMMFHHFHDSRHYVGQGSIDSEQFEKIIVAYKDRLITAKEWYEKAITGRLTANDICLTFDDALLSQYEIALPVMEQYGLTGFWFVYTSVIEGNIEKLEIYRKFRHIYFDNIDDFYTRFFKTVSTSLYASKIENSLKNYFHSDYSMYPFYTPNDTKFRYIRDIVLEPNEYHEIMEVLMLEYNIDEKKLAENLWMEKEHIKSLHEKGHIIGLHSHTHPTNLAKMSPAQQKKEYQTNYNILQKITGEAPKTVAHPADSYDTNTLDILKKLEIEVGFEATMKNRMVSLLTFPREDHINVFKSLKSKL